jgi:hypothetical protein
VLCGRSIDILKWSVLLDGIWEILDGVGWFLGSCKKLVPCWELRSSAQPYCSGGLNAERHTAGIVEDGVMQVSHAGQYAVNGQ